MAEAVIIPTGNEIRDGVVLDTDSAVVMNGLLKLYPCLAIHRLSPVADTEADIRAAVQAAAEYADYVILIGGSGGGHRHSDTLGRDFTHTALESCLTTFHETRIYGKNGHLWCRLILGHLGNTLLFNLPGPNRETQAAMNAFVTGTRDKLPEETILRNMRDAVISLYGEMQTYKGRPGL